MQPIIVSSTVYTAESDASLRQSVEDIDAVDPSQEEAEKAIAANLLVQKPIVLSQLDVEEALDEHTLVYFVANGAK